MITVILAFLFVNMFDTAGTLMGVAERANLRRPDGSIEGLKKSLKADSASSVIGTFVGCPPVTSYVESAAGVAAGGRTGLTAVTIAALFLLSMFLAPLAGMIPPYATAGALIFVAFAMMSSMAQDRLGRLHRNGPGRGNRADDAADLLHRQRHRHGLRHLHGAEDGHRPPARRVHQRLYPERHLYRQVRVYVRLCHPHNKKPPARTGGFFMIVETRIRPAASPAGA
jgi:hypothetical protein